MVSVSSPAETGSTAPLHRLGALAASLLIGVNLRPAITSVSALLHETTTEFALAPFAATLLATLPVIAFGVTAPLGPLLARRFGPAPALLIAMSALAASLLVRILAPALLLPGTFLAGAAIMAAGTVLPQYLKALDASGLWVGLSTMTFGAGAALGAGLVVPIHAVTGRSAAVALGVWALLPVVAAVAMGVVVRRSPAAARPGRARLAPAPGAVRTVALVTVVFGIQALLYFAVTSWLPKLLVDRGLDAAAAGAELAWFSVIGLVPTLVTPVLARRARILAWYGPALGAVIAGGVLWLALADGPYPVIIGVLGVVQSAAFGLGMALIVSLSANPGSAGVMSAIAQGAGYALAGLGSFLLGVTHDATGSWTPSLLAMAGLAVLLSLVVALTARRSPADLQSAV